MKLLDDPSIDVADPLLDEPRELTGLPRLTRWLVHPDGSVTPGPVDAAVAQIASTALAFPKRGTRRADWRDCDVRASGDNDYGSRFLDELNVV